MLSSPRRVLAIKQACGENCDFLDFRVERTLTYVIRENQEKRDLQPKTA
jgi:hypothetical protein